MINGVLRWFFVLVFLSGGVVLGGMSPTFTLRYLTIESEVILIGEPLKYADGELPTRYKVKEVLKGDMGLVGKVVLVSNDGLAVGGGLFAPDYDGKDVRFSEALLFLGSGVVDGDVVRYGNLSSGVRGKLANGKVAVPQQMSNPGPQNLMASERKWVDVVREVRLDLPRIAEVMKLGAIEDARARNKALFGWIEKHRAEFGGGYYGETKGWASVESKVFNWILESCIAEDCWRVVELREALDTGSNAYFPSFASVEGRALLVRKVFDEELKDRLRVEALEYLGNSLWYSYASEYPRTSVVSVEVQRDLLGKVIPLLKKDDAAWRIRAVRCVDVLSVSTDATYGDRSLKEGYLALVELRKVERDKEVLKVLDESLGRIRRIHKDW